MASKSTLQKTLSLLLCLVLLTGILDGCAVSVKAGTAPGTTTASASAATQSAQPNPSGSTATAGQTAESVKKPADEASSASTATASPAVSADQQAALDKNLKEALVSAEALYRQYDYAAALKVLSSPELAGSVAEQQAAAIRADMETLVNYTGDIPHIFFHSLIVYPEMIFKDKKTPMGGYNSGFSEKAEIEKMLPQLYERGYVLYDLNDCWEMRDGKMTRKEILLPPGKKPLILSVDDVAYAYGAGFASALTVKENGALMYQVKNPDGIVVEMADGDVMGVLDQFVLKYPDFAYHGHKGTIALTGYQGAFGYSYDTEQGADQIRKVSTALKADGWNFASHSYTHNRTNYFGPGSNPANIKYDINKWVAKVVPCIGPTRLFVAPFGYRVRGQGLQYILDDGFNIYCTVDSVVYNELNPDYALMSRIEMSGYSMTYYKDTLNKFFYNVDEVFDKKGRPPVIG